MTSLTSSLPVKGPKNPILTPHGTVNQVKVVPVCPVFKLLFGFPGLSLDLACNLASHDSHWTVNKTCCCSINRTLLSHTSSAVGWHIASAGTAWPMLGSPPGSLPSGSKCPDTNNEPFISQLPKVFSAVENNRKKKARERSCISSDSQQQLNQDGNCCFSC